LHSAARGTPGGPGRFQGGADWKSAIQQITNLRYGGFTDRRFQSHDARIRISLVLFVAFCSN